MMVVEFDDFGSNHVINSMCQSHDCRDMLDKLHYANQAFKVTLFAIPGEMTAELCRWCKANNSWVELAMHGFYHSDNYECAKMTYQEIEEHMRFFKPMLDEFFVKGFRAPGWQISDDWYKWLEDNGWWVADQQYNFDRLMGYGNLPAYINNNGQFRVNIMGRPDKPVAAHHGHVWDCCDNGIYETIEYLIDMVKHTDTFAFVSEVLR